MRSRKILFVLHCLGYNGTPVFALSLISMLCRNGYQCSVWSLQDGELKEEFIRQGIEISLIDTCNAFVSLENDLKSFDIAILFTICTYQIYEVCRNLLPTVWYIHEGQNISRWLLDQHCLSVFKKAIRVWVVSEYAQEYIWKTYRKRTTVIHNYVSDYYSGKKNCQEDEKIRFLIVGGMIERKGFDILFDAFLMLSEREKNACEIHFAGEQEKKNAYVEENIKKIEQYGNVTNHYLVMKREELFQLYSMADVVVVPSRDESCSLVVLEAFMMGKPVIISQYVGAKYMVSKDNGWILEHNNAENLKRLLAEIIDNQYDLKIMGRNARNSYLEYATESKYEMEFIKKISELFFYNNFFWKSIHHLLFWMEKGYIRWFRCPFGNHDIKWGSRIVIYGAGKNGQKWGRVLCYSKYYEIVGWVDKYVRKEGITAIEEIDNMEYDYVFVTILNRELQEEIFRELSEYGVTRKHLLTEEMVL